MEEGDQTTRLSHRERRNGNHPIDTRDTSKLARVFTASHNRVMVSCTSASAFAIPPGTWWCRSSPAGRRGTTLRMGEREPVPRRSFSVAGIAAAALVLLDTAQRLGVTQPASAAGSFEAEAGLLRSRLRGPIAGLEQLKKNSPRVAAFPAWLEGAWDVETSLVAGGLHSPSPLLQKGGDTAGVEEALRGVVGATMRFVSNGKGGAVEDRGFGARAAAEVLGGFSVADARCVSSSASDGFADFFSSAALEATQGQMDGLFSRLPYKCHLEEVASVGD